MALYHGTVCLPRWLLEPSGAFLAICLAVWLHFTTVLRRVQGVDGQTSWLDPANQTWQELGLESKESRRVQEPEAPVSFQMH